MRFAPPLRAFSVVAFAAVVGCQAQCQFETRAAFPVGGNAPISLAIGDFNRDGNLDVAEVNYLPSGSVEILLGNGDGTFRQGGSYPVAVQPFYAATASLRGNGILDLVVGDTLSADVYVMLGNGDGTFQSAVAYPPAGGPRWSAWVTLLAAGKLMS